MLLLQIEVGYWRSSLILNSSRYIVMANNDQPIRVLIVDDSEFMRNRLSMMLMKCPDMKIVGTAKNGYEAIEQIQHTLAGCHDS